MSFFSKSDFESIIVTSKRSYTLTLEAVKHRHVSDLASFALKITRIIPQEERSQSPLDSLLVKWSSNPFQETVPTNLSLWKDKLNQFTKEFNESAAVLLPQSLLMLDNTWAPEFLQGNMEQLMDLTSWVDKLPRVSLPNQDSAHLDLAEQFLALGAITKAWQLAMHVVDPSNEGKRNHLLYRCGNEASKERNFLKALQIAHSITHPFLKDTILNEVCIKYAVAGQAQQSLDVARMITHECFQQKAIGVAASAFVDIEEVARGVEIADGMEDLALKDELLEYACHAYLKNNDVSNATEVASRIYSEPVKLCLQEQIHSSVAARLA
ncbi:MAG: hypothetical protein EBZ47_07940 [Chlamydiae bacterium]|nr:hypothetical protein [Chlamydiota bacterium]